MKFKEIVFDVETKKAFSEVGGRMNYEKLGISVVGAYFYEDNTFRAYTENELKYFFEKLAAADRLIGFNIKGFDIPVLQPYATFNLNSLPTLDLMDEAAKLLGYRISLDSLSQATLKSGKTGDGLKAIKLFKEGRIQEIKDYCLQDVRLTRDLYEYAKREHRLYFLSPLGQRKELSIEIHEPIKSETPHILKFQTALF